MVRAAPAASDPRAGQVVGARKAQGERDGESPRAITSLLGKFEQVKATRGAPFTEADLPSE
jgi:hypothetical protein